MLAEMIGTTRSRVNSSRCLKAFFWRLSARRPRNMPVGTMVKYIRAIEFIEDYKTIGQGQGGWREDYQYFSQEAGI